MRIIGIETEHGIRVANEGEYERICNAFQERRCTLAGGALYLDNPRAMYKFIGHGETNTPECAGALEAALYDTSEQLEAAEFIGATLFSANVGTNGDGELSSYGRHVNIETYRPKKWAKFGYNYVDNSIHVACSNEMVNTLNLLLSVMTLIDGSGWFDENGFRTSQRSAFLARKNGFLIVDTSTLELPTVLLKGPDYSRDRIQIGTPDSVQSEFQKYLVSSIYAMAVNGIERGYADISADNDEILRTFHELPRCYNDAASFKIKTSEGFMSAIELHRYFIDRLHWYDENAKKEWARVIDVIESGDFVELWRELDAATKLKIYDSIKRRHGLTDLQFNMAFHKISEDECNYGIYQKLKAGGAMRRMFTDAQILHARKNPPNTRAKGRALAVHRFGMKADFHSWESVTRSDESRYDYRYADRYFLMANPAKTYEEEIAAFAVEKPPEKDQPVYVYALSDWEANHCPF